MYHMPVMQAHLIFRSFTATIRRFLKEISGIFTKNRLKSKLLQVIGPAHRLASNGGGMVLKYFHTMYI
jgi:hypothetical protein